MELTLVLIVSVFASAALIECFFGCASIRAAISRDYERTVILVPVTDKMRDAEYVLRQTAAMMECSDISCRCVIVDIGADEETLEICRRFASAHGGFEIRQEDF